jgi:hypothetical protein
MKRVLLWVYIASNLLFCNAYGQSFSIKDFITVSSLSSKKFDSYIGKKNFVPAGKWFQNDTIINTYRFRMKNKNRDTQTVKRTIETYQRDKIFSFAFNTSSENEYIEAKKELKRCRLCLRKRK